jgi:membrane protein DedA with SNARE-associated domain
MLAFLDDFFHQLEDLSTSPWFYLVIFVIAYLDSMIPIVPSETMVILGGVAAGQGDLDLPIVIACGAAGAFLGDTTAYLIGRRYGPWVERHLFSKPKGQERLRWAGHQLEVRGGLLLVTARFIPGGRTVVTFSSGMTHQPFKRFVGFIALAGLIWATYASLLGFIGGKTFADNHTVAFIVAFGCALSVTALIEVFKRVRDRRREKARSPAAAPAEEALER